MTPFLSSTLFDLVPERTAVLEALSALPVSPRAMERFAAAGVPASDTALEELRLSDVMILVIGFKAGSLLPDGSGSTYTSSEYAEACSRNMEILTFVRIAKSDGASIGTWRNEEADVVKREALEEFKARATSNVTPAYFESADQLGFRVLLALRAWEDKGRPGARRSFSDTESFFDLKTSSEAVPLLDFTPTMIGRNAQMEELDAFLENTEQRICVVSGRGGIGKSKLLHDWGLQQGDAALFVKDDPQWHADSSKEVPVSCRFIVVEDAHRREHDLGKAIQIMRDRSSYQGLKLVVSTRPGSVSLLVTEIARRHIDRRHIGQLSELQELDRQQSRDLARDVLGPHFSNWAEILAEVSNNSPLILVAGGRLIASQRIDPAALPNVLAFRSIVFDTLLSDLDLSAPTFFVDARRTLYLVAALGPLQVEADSFGRAASAMLGRPAHEVLSTIGQLAVMGLLSKASEKTRVVPDVLADFLLEEACINSQGMPTGYAYAVYENFGATYLKTLMRNLSELDWRIGLQTGNGLKLLGAIWEKLFQRFRAGDEFERATIIDDLAAAAVYQPEETIRLVREALSNPIVIDEKKPGSFRLGQPHVRHALLQLLEATAHHRSKIRESVSILWDLAVNGTDHSSRGDGAQAVLKRLAAWHRYGDPALNASMLDQALLLMQRPDAFNTDFTPFDLIDQILQREGEFSEMTDDSTISFGGFGLNYPVIGPIRERAIAYLSDSLESADPIATRALERLGGLLRNTFNRVGRASTDQEIEWQRAERELVLGCIRRRFPKPKTPILEAKLFDTIRFATAINVPEYVRSEALQMLEHLKLSDEALVVDSLLTSDGRLPILSVEFSEESWERPLIEIMQRGRSALERIISDLVGQARFTIDQVNACLDLRLPTGGFHRFMLTFTDRPNFLQEMATQMEEGDARNAGPLSSVFAALHLADRDLFRVKAEQALRTGATQVIHAVANNLRVFEGADERDVKLIRAYAAFPDSITKQGASFAIAYMGKFSDLREHLKDAALAIATDGDAHVAAQLADAFGPYGVPLTSLSQSEATKLATQFVKIPDWDAQQGAIPRFLGRFVIFFPEQVFAILVQRVQQANTAGIHFHTFDRIYDAVPFAGLPPDKRAVFCSQVLTYLIAGENDEGWAALFWEVGGNVEVPFAALLKKADEISGLAPNKILLIIRKAPSRLAFQQTDFVRELLRKFTGDARVQLVNMLAYQATHSVGSFMGTVADHKAAEQNRLREALARFPTDYELEDLRRALESLQA